MKGCEIGMIDREKVIKGLEYCGKREFSCSGCPYYKDESPRTVEECLWRRIDEALALLKEQKIGHLVVLANCSNAGVYCSECHTKMFDRYPMKKKLSQFCGHCGAKMEEKVK